MKPHRWPQGISSSPARPFRVLLLLGLPLAAAGLAGAALLGAGVLIPFASACLQACAQNPLLISLARGSASLFVAVVAGGVAAFLVVLAGQLISTRRLIRRVESRAWSPPRRLARAAEDIGMAGRLTYVPDDGAFAFCYGFFSPRICVSSGMVRQMSAEELRAVLLHEGFHLRRKDPLKVLVSRLVAGFLFPLPVVADLRDRYLVGKELAADAHVVEEMSPRPLASALLKLCRPGARPLVAEIAAAAVGPFSVMSERIRQITDPAHQPAPLGRRRVAASLAVVTLLLGVSVGAGYAAEAGAAPSKSCCASTGASCVIQAEGAGFQQ